MKNFPALLQTHLQGEVTTLASCWKITRQDGELFYFTDHDVDLTVGGVVYEAAAGYSRTAIVSKSDLSADNLEVHGVLTSDRITDEDLRAGLFDRASVEIFLVNYVDPDGTGIGKMRKGSLGEAAVHEGRYVIELRGLSQGLSTRIGQVYTPDCRADLFDAKCGIAAASFKELTEVSAFTDRRTFQVPVNETQRYTPNTASAETYGAQLGDDGKLRLLINDVQDGSPERPFFISSAAGLDAIRLNPYAHYALVASVDLSGWGFFTPIPTLYGSLDGRGFQIQTANLSHAGGTTTGLFVLLKAGGIIKRVGMTSPSVANGSGATYKAALAGQIEAGAVVSDCYVTGGTVTTDGDRAGGLIGSVLTGASVIRCYAAILISGTVGTLVGGLFAAAQGGTTQTALRFDSTVATTSALGSGATGVVALTTANAKLAVNYPGWDFFNVWKGAVGADYPRFRAPGR